jgi:hypothetical protein
MGPETIIGLGADIISGVYGNQARRREADRAFNRSKQMFDYQNKYNTPARQMERLKRAGLNPALMYGKGTTGNAEGYTQQAPAQQLNVAGAKSLDTALMFAQIEKTKAETGNLLGLTPEAKARISKLVSDKKLVNAQILKTAQEKGNLVTVGDVLLFEKEVKKLEMLRNKKGFIKGDTIGNVLEMVGLDPKNNPEDRLLVQSMLGTWFGADLANKLIGAFMKAKGPKGTTINKGPSYPTINNYGGQNPLNSVKPKG